MAAFVYWGEANSVFLMAISTSSLVKQVAERHAAFSVWYHESKAATARLRQDHYAALTSPDTFELIPAVYPGYLEEIRQHSVTIPPSDRGDKVGFCFDFIKTFLGCVDDTYDGEYLIGRSNQLDTPNVFVMRVLDSGQIVIFHINLKVEGNLVIVKIGYAGLDSRVDRSEQYLGWNYTGHKGQIDWNRLDWLCHSDKLFKHSNGIVGARIPASYYNGFSSNDSYIRPFLGWWFVASMALFLAGFAYFNSKFPEGELPKDPPVWYSSVTLIAPPILMIWRMRCVKRRVRANKVLNSLNRNPSAFFTIPDNHQNLLQMQVHQVFTQSMNQAVDTATRRLLDQM